MSEKQAELLVFPLERRIDLVRRTAGELLALDGEDANGYWRATARRLLEDITGQGRSMDAARKEVLCFFEAVQMEFRKAASARRETASA